MEFKIDELKELLEKSDGFMITVTSRTDTKLNHYFFTEKFYDGDMLSSLAEVEKLVINKLKHPANRVEDATIVESEDDKDTK